MTTGPTPAHCTWKHGTLETHQLGGMTGPIVFNMPDGPTFAPLASPPWEGEALSTGLPGHIRGLRGVFPCLPFGISRVPKDAPPAWRGLEGSGASPMHGPGANGLWDVQESGQSGVRLRFTHGPCDPFALSDQEVTPEPDKPAATFRFSCLPRADIFWPVGFHVMLTWTEGMRLDPGPFAMGLTYPGSLEPGLMQTTPGVSFTSLAEVPGRKGRVDMARPDWNGPSEDVVMLCCTGGAMIIDYPSLGRRLRIGWDAATLPSCLIWYSRFGLSEAPWNNRYTAIGIEPVAAAFDFHPDVSAAPNPINKAGFQTAIAFRRDVPFSTCLRLEAFAL